MRTMATALDEPISATTRDGIPVLCTHVSYGFTYHEWAESPIRSYKIVGVIGPDGKFLAISQPEYADFGQADYEMLLEMSGKSGDGDFTKDEVIDLHDAIAARNTKRLIIERPSAL